MSNSDSKEITKRDRRGGLEDSNMSFGDHLMELRSRIIKSLLGLVVGFIVCMFFSWDIIAFLASPLVSALELNGFSSDLLATGIATPFITYMKVALLSGVFLTCPWIFYQMWGFVAAGLYPHEKRYVNTFVPFAAILFVLGGFFFITVVAPISMNFFLNFNKGFQVNSKPSTWHKLLMGKLGEDTQQHEAIEEGQKTTETNPAAAAKTQEPVEADEKDRMKMEVAFPIPFSKEFVKLSVDFPYHGQGDKQTEQTDAAPGKPAEDKVVAEKPVSTPETVKAGTGRHTATIDVKCTINEYVYFVLLLALAFGVSFQMPLAVFLLGRLNLVSLETLRKVRKYVVLGIVIFSAVITPPDVVSQILMSIPMYCLYELGILLVRFWPQREI